MKCLFIANPVSGKKKKVNIEYILEKLKSKFDVVDYMQSQHRNHIFELISQNASFYDSIVVKGGDGTLNEAINALSNIDNPPALGYLPSGTTNDVGKSFGISKNIKKSLEIVLAGNIIEPDILEVNDKKAMYVCGVGMCTRSSYATSQTKKQKFGRVAYLFAGAKEIFSAPTVDLTLETKDETISGSCALGLCLNSKCVGGFKFNKYYDFKDGLMDLCFIFEKKPRKKVSFSSKLKVAKMFLFGLHRAKAKNRVKILKTNACKITIHNNECATIDGECCTDKVLNIQVLKRRIKFYAK